MCLLLKGSDFQGVNFVKTIIYELLLKKNVELEKELERLRIKEEKWRASRKQIDKIFNSLNDVVFSTDPYYSQLYEMTSACERIYGVSKQEYYMHHDESFSVWRERSKHKWSISFGEYQKYIKT